MNLRHISAEDILNLRFMGDFQLSPDASKIAFALSWIDAERDTYRTGIWVASSTKSGDIEAITNLDPKAAPFHDRLPSWSPDGTKLAFLSSRSGKNEIWLISMSGGEPRCLTSGVDSVSEFAWAPDGKRIAFVGRARPACDIPGKKGFRVISRLRYKANGIGYTDNRPRHVWVLDTETCESRQFTAGNYEEYSPVWSPHGNEIAFLSDRSTDQDFGDRPDVWIACVDRGDSCVGVLRAEDTGAGALEDVSLGLRRASGGIGACSHPAWSPKGDRIAFFANTGGISAANTQVFVSTPDGVPVCLTGTFDRSAGCSMTTDIKYRISESGPRWEPDGTAVYFVATDGGHSGIYRVPVSGGAPVSGGSSVQPVVDRAGLTVFSLDVGVDSRGGVRLAYVAGTQTNPTDLYSGVEPHRLTWVNEGVLSTIELSAHEKIVYSGDNGWPIESWIMKPIGYQEGKRYPVVVQIHGGPASTVGDVFHHEYQLMARRGYGVFYMNFRGSKGYGEAFSRAIVGDRGGAEYRDIMAGVDAIENLPWVDSSRIYVTGGSFGGYETNWIVTQTNRFRAAVTQRSCSNIYSKIGTADNGFYHNVAYMGADLWDNEDFLMSRSPIRYAPNVRTPMLIVHSDQDLRLPLEQAEQWYTALKRLGRAEVEFLLFHGENHDLSRTGKPSNRIERLERIIEWFDRHNP